jgi:hypothetical protein
MCGTLPAGLLACNEIRHASRLVLLHLALHLCGRTWSVESRCDEKTAPTAHEHKDVSIPVAPIDPC